MPKIELLIISLVIFIIILLIGYHYIFHIYEVDYRISSKTLYADFQSTVTIEAVPLNAFGFKAPFRDAKVVFRIEEGEGLIDIVLIDNINGKMIVKAKGSIGKVCVSVKSPFAILPTLIEINIVPNLSMNF